MTEVSYVADIELVPRVVMLRTEEVVRRGTRRRTSVQSLTSHGHANLARHGGGTESRLGFTILNNRIRSFLEYNGN